jgi:predicted nucleotidyltransferase
MALSPLERAALTTFRTRLAARFGARLDRAVLFGSRARGEGHEESDLDVLVVVHDLSRAERADVIDDAGAIELETGLVLSPIVRAAVEWRDASALGREIARDGVPL